MQHLASRYAAWIAVLALAGCGARTPLGLGPAPASGDGGPIARDGSVGQDAGPRPGRDAGPPGLDAGPPPLDAGPPPEGMCFPSATLSVVTQTGALSWPAVASFGSNMLLVWTRQPPSGRASQIESLALAPGGMPIGSPHDVIAGEGGTLVGVPTAMAFVALVHHPDGTLDGVPLLPDGTLATMPGMPVAAMTDSLRPGLAVGATTYAVAWNQGTTTPDTSLLLIAQQSDMTAMPAALMVPGADPWIVPSDALTDAYRLSFIQAGEVQVWTVDMSATVVDMQAFREPGENVVAARVLPSTTRTLAMLTSRGRGTRVRITNGATVTTDVSEVPGDLGADIDPDSRTVLAAFSTTSGGMAHIRAFASTQLGPATVDIASFTAMGGDVPHPAVITTGFSRFLVLWAEPMSGGRSAIMIAGVSCPVPVR